jgi:hypothetical protein
VLKMAPTPIKAPAKLALFGNAPISPALRSSAQKRARIWVKRVNGWNVSENKSLFHRRQGTQRLGELFDDLSEYRAFGSRDPLEAQPLRLDTGELEEPLVEWQALGGTVIATNIVAVAHVSAKHHHPVGSLLEGAQNQFRRHSPGARDADDLDVGRILHARHTGTVGPGVAAPIAQVADDFRFVVVAGHQNLSFDSLVHDRRRLTADRRSLPSVVRCLRSAVRNEWR